MTSNGVENITNKLFVFKNPDLDVKIAYLTFLEVLLVQLKLIIETQATNNEVVPF